MLDVLFEKLPGKVMLAKVATRVQQEFNVDASLFSLSGLKVVALMTAD